MLAVVIADAAAEGDFQFERWKFGTTESELRQLAMWRQMLLQSSRLYSRRKPTRHRWLTYNRSVVRAV